MKWTLATSPRRVAFAFYAKTEGHPLHLRFILASLIERGQGVSPQEIDDLPGAPGKDIMAYYSVLWRSLPEEGQEILHLLASTKFPWASAGIIEALDPLGTSTAAVSGALRDVRHLLINSVLCPERLLRAYHLQRRSDDRRDEVVARYCWRGGALRFCRPGKT